MEKILLAGYSLCLTENISFLFKLSGFDLVFATNIEEAINLIAIKQYFNLLIIPRTELVKPAPGFLAFLNNPARRPKILIFDGPGNRVEEKIVFDEFFESEGISFCSSDRIIDEVKRLFLDKRC